MIIPALVTSALLAVTPVAHLSVFGPSNIGVGVPCVLDTAGTVADFPPLVKVVPVKDVKTLTVSPSGDIVFVAAAPGNYRVILNAISYADDKKTSLVSDVSVVDIVAGTPAPPAPPAPTDPLLAAAVQYHADMDAAYAKEYGVAATAIHAKAPLVTTKQTTATNLASDASSAFKNRFAAFIPGLTPPGQEPTTAAQWANEEALATAISKAYGGAQ